MNLFRCMLGTPWCRGISKGFQMAKSRHQVRSNRKARKKRAKTINCSCQSDAVECSAQRYPSHFKAKLSSWNTICSMHSGTQAIVKSQQLAYKSPIRCHCSPKSRLRRFRPNQKLRFKQSRWTLGLSKPSSALASRSLKTVNYPWSLLTFRSTCLSSPAQISSSSLSFHLSRKLVGCWNTWTRKASLSIKSQNTKAIRLSLKYIDRPKRSRILCPSSS